MTLGFSIGFLIRSREPNTSYTTMKSNSPEEEEQVAGLACCFSCHCCCRVKFSRGLAFLVIFLLLGSSDFVTSAAGLGFDSTTSRGGLGSSASRRVLHEPLFPIVHSPAPAPTPGSSESQSPPQIPLSNQQPFFPLSSPPPPPPTDPSSDTSIPVNPKKDSGNNKSSTKNKNTVIGVIVSLCTIAALGGLIFFLHQRKKKRDPWASNHTFLDETPLTGPHGQNGSGNLRVFQVPSPVTSKLAVNGGSDVLYLGTMEPLANSHRTRNEDTNKDMDSHDRDEETHMLHCHARKQNYNSDDYRSHSKDDNVDDNHDAGKNNNASTFGIAKGNGDVDRFQRRTSPEVHPLPPLSKKPCHTRTSVCSDSSDEDSFYSPRCPSSSSSRSNNDSSPRVSACKRLFSPPKQQPSIVSLKSESTHSYPSSSATSSGTSSPSALDSPPCAPINPSLVTPPIRSHLHSHSSPSHHSPNQQSQNPPPPPPPPPPLFQSPLSPISHSAKPKPDQKSSPPYSSPAIDKSNLISIPASPDSKSRKSSPSGFSKTPPTSSTGRGTSSPPTSASPPSRRNPHSPLPPLPTRPPPPFLSSSRSGRVSQPSSLSPNCPPPPPPPPTQNKPSPPEMLPPLPSRPSYRPHSGLYSSRTSQSLQPLAPNSEDAEEQQSTQGTNGTPRPKLKPLHWDKVRASPDRAMVWDQLKSGSFKLNEEMIETLFVYNTPTQVKGEGTKRSTPTPPPLNQRILESKKSQNIAILLRALSVTKEEVCDALLEGTSDNLSTELLETLSKMAPSKEEEIRLKEYNGDTSKLGPAERFLKAVLDIPFAFKRVDALLYRANFKEEINYIRKSFETLEAACEELRSSRLFLKLLEAVLKTGNRMNVGTIRGDAQAFKLDTLLKLVDVKGTDGKTTLLHFVVQEIIKAEGARVACPGEQPIPNSASDIINDKLHDLGTQVQSQKEKEDEYRKLGLQVVAGLSTEMNNVKKAAGIDSDALSNSISKLATGLGKLRETLQMDETIHSKDGKVEGSSKQGNFHRSVESFLQQAVEDIHRIQDEEKKAFSRVREITEYFHGDAGKEEAHPLRFFVVVRDFLGVLDQVCREIGRTQTKNSLSYVRPYPILAPISVPVSVQAFSRPFPRGFYDRRPDSSDEESLSP